MRLTKKYEDGSYGIEKCTDKHEKKLGRLEDIEEELGIDLSILFKALDPETVIYYIENDEMWEAHEDTGYLRMMTLTSIYFMCQYSGEVTQLKINDYGRTWALTEKELK